MDVMIYQFLPLHVEYTAVLFTIQCINCFEPIPRTDLVGEFANLYRMGVIVSYYTNAV